MTVTTKHGVFAVSTPTGVYLLVARLKMLRWFGFALALSCASCGGAPPTVAPSALGASAPSVLRASSSNPAAVIVNTSGTQLALFFSPAWDVRDVRLAFYRDTGGIWVLVSQDVKAAMTAATAPTVADYSRTFAAGRYRGDLTRIDTPVNQTATIWFDFDQEDGRAANPGNGDSGGGPGDGGDDGAGDGGDGGGSGSGDCKVDLPDQARPECPPGLGGVPPGQERR